MELISCLLWSCLIWVAAKGLCSRALYSWVRSFCNAGRWRWVGSLWSHSWTAQCVELFNSRWFGSLCYVVLIISVAVLWLWRCPFFGTPERSCDLGSAPWGSCTAGLGLWIPPTLAWQGWGGWPPSSAPGVLTLKVSRVSVPLQKYCKGNDFNWKKKNQCYFHK